MSSNSSLNLSTFPPDVLLHIFRYVCALPKFKKIEDEEDAYRRSGVMDLECISPSSPEIVLSCVCRSWRELMLSISSFWTVICLGTPGYELDDSDLEPGPPPSANVLRKQMELMELWVKRSGQRSLSFVLRLELEAGRERDKDAAKRLVRAVALLSKRWGFLSARCHATLISMLMPYISYISSHPKRLRQFDHNHWSEGTSFSIAWKHELANSPHFFWTPTKSELRGAKRHNLNNIGKNLTSFTFHPQSYPDTLPLGLNDALIILACCRSLKKFKFTVTDDALFENCLSDSTSWVLKLGLTHLSLSSSYNLEFGPLLDILAAPYLEVLSLTGPYYEDWMADSYDMNFDIQTDWTHVTSFLKRTSKPLSLEKLYLEGLPLNAESVAEILEMSPYIEELKLDGRVFDSYLAARLTWTPGDKDGINLLPDLKELTVVGCSTTYVLVAELVHMVYSRARYTFLIPVSDDRGWVEDEQSEQWEKDTGPMDMEMIYLTDTKDPSDAFGCHQMQYNFFTNPIISWFTREINIGIYIDSL